MSGWSSVPNWVIRSTVLKGSEKLLYIALLNHADQHGNSWPSLKRLSEEVGASRNTILKHLDRLAELGLVVKRKRERDDGGNASNLYHVNVWAPEPELHHPSTSNEPPPSSHMNYPGSSEVLEEYPEKKTQLEDTSPPLGAGEIDPPPDGFDEFYRAYPRKMKPGDARKAFKQMTRTTPARVIIEAAREYAARPDLPERQFIPYPASWLRAEAWKNEPDPPKKSNRDLAHEARTAWMRR